MKSTKLFLFGVPRLERAEEPVDLSRRKVVALMAYLAMARYPLSRDTLAALLWPDRDQPGARASLRRDLSRLKRALGQEHLKADRHKAQIVHAATFWLDVAVFKDALSQVQAHHPSSRKICDECAASLTQAATLYQDDFMAGFALPDSAAFDDWHFFESEALRRQLAQALQLLIDWHVSRGEFDQAAGYGRRWVALDDLHEPARRRLMQLYAWAGQYTAALRQYQEIERLLQEELGVAPEEETEALHQAVRTRQLPAPRTRTGPAEKGLGRYERLDLLAVGGHAEVYVGQDHESGEYVVIKRLRQELLVKDSAYLERFIREGQALSRLEHPNIVRMLETYEEAGQHHIVMEYVPGGNLRQLLDKAGPLPLKQALDIALELADALARAHHLNIIHRDLKPDNVLLAQDGTPRLTDFGLARLRRDDVRLTRTGAVMGSPAYMSPEALRGEDLDPRSDIWSFGVLLFEMVAGRRPFEGQQLTPVLVSILQDEAPPVTVFRRETPHPLANLLQRMLQKEAQWRPASMRQVAAEVEAIRAGVKEPFFMIAPELARHFDLAQLPERAVYFLQAGDQARQTIAIAEALRYFQASLAHWPDADRAGRAALLRRMGECQWIMGDLHGALETYEDCYRLFEETNDLQGTGAVQRAVGRLYWEIGERERALDYYHRSLQTLEKIPESVELARTVSSISQMHMLASQYDEAIVWGQRAIDLAQRLQVDKVLAHALNNMGVAYMETGQMARGKAMVRESLQRALNLRLPHDACRAYLNLGKAPARDYEERYAILEELADYAATVQAPLYGGSAQIELADIEWVRGQWRAALARRAEIRRWMDRAPSIGYLRGLSSALLGRVHNDLGQYEKALQVLERENALVRSQNEVQMIGPHLGQTARALAELGRDEEAVAVLHQLLSAVEAQPYVHRDSVASLLFAVNWLTRRRPVLAALATALRFRQQLIKADAFGAKPDVTASLAEADAAILLAQEEGDVGEAVALLHNAAARWRDLGLSYDEARALITLAQTLHKMDARLEMAAACERASEILQSLALELDDDEQRSHFLNSPPLQTIAQCYTSALDNHPSLVSSQPQSAAPAELPGPETAQRAVHNLPAQPTPFVGRQNEVNEITSVLARQADYRLLTLTGPGGIGKTRLALAAAATLLPRFQHGVYFVPLAPLSSAEHIVSAILEALGLMPVEGNEPRQQLLSYLQQRQLLLVLDNFEHLLQGVDLVADILEQAGQVKIIATSRERLNLSLETIYPIGGLDYPSQSDADRLDEPELRQYSAVNLLLQRAQMVAPGLALDQDDLRHAVRICHMVQGMPLALVLAAGWFELLRFDEIASELSQSLSVLESTARDLPERQRSVHAAFDYSWKRLPHEARQAFMALSVCRGGFTRQAAETIAGAGLHALRTLANKSFVVVSGKSRFDIHEVLRQLGLEQLQASGAAEAAREAHSDYYLSALRDLEPDLRGGRQLQALKEIEIELENVRGAWHWALQRGDALPIDAALESGFLFSYMISRYTEGIELLQMARDRFARLADRSGTPISLRITARLSFLLAHARPGAAQMTDVERAVALAERTDDRREIAFALLAQGCLTVYVAGDPRAAIPIIESALEKYQALDDPFYVVLAKIWLGYCHGNATGLQNFNRYMREALQLAQATDNKVYQANATSNLAAGAFCEGDYGAAGWFSQEALVVAQEMGLRLALAHGKVQVGLSRFLEGDLATAQALAHEGLEQAREINYATTSSYASSVLSLCQSLTGNGAEGRRLAQEALATPVTVFGRILAHWAAAVSYCELGEHEPALQHARQSIEEATEAGYPGMTTWALPALAIALAEQGQWEQAVGLLARATAHPLSPSAWLSRWSMIDCLHKRLARELGEEAFRTAWERGLALQPGVTKAEILGAS